MTAEDEEVETLTELLIDTGMKAQLAAMHALIFEVEKCVADNPSDRAKVIGLAGALAFTRWKLDAALAEITKVHPQYGELITGAQEAAEKTFGDQFEESARKTARKFNIRRV